MSDAIAVVLSRITQIRAAFGANGGVLGVTSPGAAGFDQLLQKASDAAKAKSASSSTGAAAGRDPMERVATGARASSAKAAKPLGTSSTNWPGGVPEEAERYAAEFQAAAQATGVPIEILLAVAWAESGFNPDAESSAGAQGMMQLMPATSAGNGIDPTDPAQNIMCGANYLKVQYERFGSWDLAFAAYNAGPGAVAQYGGVPPYRETESYIATINSYLDQITPATGPALPSTPAPAGAAPAAAAVPRAAVPAAATQQRRALEMALRDLTGVGLGAVRPAFTELDAVSSFDLRAAPATEVIASDASLGGLVAPAFAGADTMGTLDQRRGSGAALAVGATSAEGYASAAVASAGLAAGDVAATPAGNDTEMTTSAAAWPERLLALVQRSQRDGQSSHRITVRLDPPELGTVNVSFELQGDQVNVVVRPESAAGGQLLSQQRDRIATLLAREGLQLSGFDVGSEADTSSPKGRSNGSNRHYHAVDLDPINLVPLTLDRALRL